MTTAKRELMAAEMEACLKENIMPYWIGKMADPRGGYYGRIDGYDVLHDDAPKGAIMHARILWTMSAAYRATGNEEYLEGARRAYNYIREHFIDREYGGVFQSVTAKGEPLDTRKQFYAIAFVIYGLSEYYKTTGEKKALDEAISLFRSIEDHSRDREKGGYIEAMTRDWQPIEDMRLSEKDENSCKTMNTHLHILEAYSSLYSVWNNEEVEEALRNLIKLFLDKIIDKRNHHLGLFFDRDWNHQDGDISYGHDIEASWLLLEAGQAIGDESLIGEVMKATKKLGEAAIEGRCVDGSMIYERHKNGTYDNEKHWWVQAETLVGHLYLWKYHKIAGQDDFARRTWDYIKNNLLDHENGEWFWSILPSGKVNLKEDKAGYWKCPYHNGRMVLEGCRLLRSN